MKEDKVLVFLREQKGAFVSGEEISKKLKVTRAAVWKDIQVLKKTGYEIEAQPHLGYRLLGAPDRLFADEISHGLKTRVVGKSIISYDTIGSTNDAAFRLGEEGVAEGVCVLAEHQTKGRGRLGRSWQSPKGNDLLFSVLLRPKLGPSDVQKITLVAAVAVVKAVSQFAGIEAGIKWPNDIYYKEKKLGGILTEMSADSDRVKFVVVGIGLNINSSGGELPAGSVSLRDIAGKKLSRVDFARELFARLDADYRRLSEGLFDELSKEWEDLSVTSGRRVSIKANDRTVEGQAMGIDKDGALWIRKDNGIQEKVVSGDVRF